MNDVLQIVVIPTQMMNDVQQIVVWILALGEIGILQMVSLMWNSMILGTIHPYRSWKFEYSKG